MSLRFRYVSRPIPKSPVQDFYSATFGAKSHPMPYVKCTLGSLTDSQLETRPQRRVIADTGALFSVFPDELAGECGVKLDDPDLPRIPIKGLGEEDRIIAVCAAVMLTLADDFGETVSFPTTVGFAPIRYRVLGHWGALQYFKMRTNIVERNEHWFELEFMDLEYGGGLNA